MSDAARASSSPSTLPATVGPYLADVLGSLAAELDAVLPRISGNASDEDAVHDLRVAIRRIRTMLKLARPVYGRFHADAVRRAFTDAMKATGDLRDEEVLEETFADLPIKSPAFVTFRRRRKILERRLRRAMVTRVESGELAQARAMLAGLIALPVQPKRDVALTKFAAKVVAKANAEVEEQMVAPTDDVTLLHELRIAYKELRYTTELFAPALPAETLAHAEKAAKMQKRLGEVHDLDVAVQVVAKARTLPIPSRRAALQALEDLRTRKVQKYDEERRSAQGLDAPAPEPNPEPPPPKPVKPARSSKKSLTKTS